MIHVTCGVTCTRHTRDTRDMIHVTRDMIHVIHVASHLVQPVLYEVEVVPLLAQRPYAQPQDDRPEHLHIT